MCCIYPYNFMAKLIPISCSVFANSGMFQIQIFLLEIYKLSKVMELNHSLCDGFIVTLQRVYFRNLNSRLSEKTKSHTRMSLCKFFCVCSRLNAHRSAI